MKSPCSISSEDHATLFSTGDEYLEAAEILYRTPPTRLNVSMVVRYLLGHAAELMLKSLLVRHGVPIGELRDPRAYGHRLTNLVQKAAALRALDSLKLPNIVMLSASYSSKHVEYRQNGAAQHPSLDLLFGEVRVLRVVAFRHAFTSPAE
jgi:hypothetical protein